MGSMRFMSTLDSHPNKVISFDSSPGHAIATALGAGLWDERSYQAELKEDGEDDRVYEVKMSRLDTLTQPGPHKLVKVGMIHWERPRTRSGQII